MNLIKKTFLKTSFLLLCSAGLVQIAEAQSSAIAPAEAKPAAASSKILQCTTLQQKIVDKLTSKGVTHYRLEITDTSAVVTARTVGECDGGKRKIVYYKDSAAAADNKN